MKLDLSRSVAAPVPTAGLSPLKTDEEEMLICSYISAAGAQWTAALPCSWPQACLPHLALAAQEVLSQETPGGRQMISWGCSWAR